MHELAENEGLQRRSETKACPAEKRLELAEKEGLSLQRRLEPAEKKALACREGRFEPAEEALA